VRRLTRQLKQHLADVQVDCAGGGPTVLCTALCMLHVLEKVAKSCMHAADLWFKLQGSVIELKAAQSFSQWLKLLCICGEQPTIYCRHDLHVPCNQNGLLHVRKQASTELRYQCKSLENLLIAQLYSVYTLYILEQ